MADRYFLTLLVILTVAGSVWLSLVEPIVPVELALAVLLVLLGLVAVLNSNRAKARALMPLFFVAAIAYEVYLYLNNPLGYLLVSISLLSLVGLVLSFGIAPKPSQVAAVPSAAKSVASKPSEKKAAKKRSKSKKK